mgnify:FL=1
MIIGAVYMLRAVRAAMHGAMNDKWANLLDANLWRKLPYAVLIASLLVFGFFPKLLTDKIKPVTEQIVNMATAKPATPSVVVADPGSRGRESAPSDQTESQRRLMSAATELK